MGLLIPTHALPVLSYRIPEYLEEEVRPGAAVVAPLSGYSRLGIVVDVVNESEHSREYLREVLGELSITPSLAKVCCELSDSFAVPMPSVLRMALPPGLKTDRYRVVDPAPDWPWKPDSIVGHTTLRRALGGEGLKTAEDEGRLLFAVSTAEPRYTEWALIRAGADPDLSRAPRQRKVYETLISYGKGRQTSELLSETGVARGALRELVNRGAIRLEKRPEAPTVLDTGGARNFDTDSYLRDAGRVADRGGPWFWRVPTREQPAATAALVEAAIEGGEQALVLAPELEMVERLVEYLSDNLPAGYTVSPYHSGLGRKRGVVYERARNGEIDVLVGTRTAALMPMERLGAICVVDEPNGAHRAEPGYEGVPIHVRDIALERGKAEDCGVLFLSPSPTLRISAPAFNAKELPARPATHWPAARIVDMRGSGATLSSDLVDVCRQNLELGKRTALISNRLGYSTSVSCSNCGAVESCPNCDLPLALREPTDDLNCSRCGYHSEYSGECEACGSRRMRPTGFAIDRLREEVSRSLDAPVGKLTADTREGEDAPVVVATPRFVIGSDWNAVMVPDADTLLLGSYMGATEQAFRTLYGAAEAAADLILVQTRQPEHHALRAALRGDYSAFVEAEVPRLRALGYPPYAHLAALILEGREEAVWRAVESRFRPSLESGVSMSDPVPLARHDEHPTWQVLLRSADQKSVARSGALMARLAAKTSGANGLKIRVVIDPEEV